MLHKNKKSPSRPILGREPSRTGRRREHGSAYIVTLLVLFVLTALGLSLALITSSEAAMGSQERTIQRTFFAADSGLDLGLAAVMSRNDCEARCVFIEDDTTTLFNAHGLVDQIEVTKSTGLIDGPSSLTQINNSDFRNVNHYLVSRASRIARGADDIPIGRREVAQMFALDPWVSPLDCFTDVFVPCSSTNAITVIPPP